MNERALAFLKTAVGGSLPWVRIPLPPPVAVLVTAATVIMAAIEVGRAAGWITP
jgi:hypothetical protein